MLRIHPRWHDAANGPLHGEARLLWFAAPTPPAPAAPDPEDENDANTAPDDENENADAARGARTDATDPRAAAAELTRRRAERVLRENGSPEVTPKASEVISGAKNLAAELESIVQGIDQLEESAVAAEAEASHVTQIRMQKMMMESQKRRTKDQVFALETLRLQEWENLEITPAAFLANMETYVAKMKEIDDMDTDAKGKHRYTEAQRAERDAARRLFLEKAREAIAEARKKIPANMPPDMVQGMATDDELWELFSAEEKQAIVRNISEASGILALKQSVAGDTEAVTTALNEKKPVQHILNQQRMFQEMKRNMDIAKAGGKKAVGAHDDAPVSTENAWTVLQSSLNSFNQATGVEWLTLYEWYEAFNEMIESIKEVKKRKSRGKIARAALQMGHVASLIPGMGGSDLVNVLEEQQQAKNDEVMDSFVKELKNNRIDYGFSRLFGDGKGDGGLLKYYHRLGDTNRTRAILLFAAGKGLLYEIEGKSWNNYELPGGVPFRDLMPPEWTENQIDTWFGNLQFSNTQGITSQMKAGEDFVSGRATLDGYIEPFKGAVNGLSLWFAKGIANKALSKVKEGEMSALLTLIVLDAWAHNEQFRRYVPTEWLDRLAGDSKQLLIGMIKYDKAHLVEGGRGEKDPANVTHDLWEAHADGKAGKQRLGPLVVGVQEYILKMDDSLDPSKYSGEKRKEIEAKYTEIQAKVLACKTVTLPNKKVVSIYAPALRPLHIQYEPNEMRDANVAALGDDFFIERSEIINSTAEVMQYIGKVRDDGFAEPTKARYFFSHIIDTYGELTALAARKGPQQAEFARAADNFKNKLRPNLDQWAERNLQAGVGTDKLLTEKHADQKGRQLVVTLLRQGLISMSLVQKLAAEKVKGAAKLLKQYDEYSRPSTKQDELSTLGDFSFGPSNNTAA